MYVLTLITDTDIQPTFWYATLEQALKMAEEIVSQGFVVQIEKVS